MNQMTTGASNDFERATELARNMVTRWGMSDLLGPRVYTDQHQGNPPEHVDTEIRRIIDEQYARARTIIENSREKIETMTKALLDWETLNADQIDDIMSGSALRTPEQFG